MSVGRTKGKGAKMQIKYGLLNPHTMFFAGQLKRMTNYSATESVHSRAKRSNSTLSRTTRYNGRPSTSQSPLTSVQISKIKERVEEKEGIPPVQQRLIYGGKQMYVFRNTSLAWRPKHKLMRAVRSDDKTAQEYSLEGGATLHLVLALRGGQ